MNCIGNTRNCIQCAQESIVDLILVECKHVPKAMGMDGVLCLHCNEKITIGQSGMWVISSRHASFYSKELLPSPPCLHVFDFFPDPPTNPSIK
jgi:hypothetical protein